MACCTEWPLPAAAAGVYRCLKYSCHSCCSSPVLTTATAAASEVLQLPRLLRSMLLHALIAMQCTAHAAAAANGCVFCHSWHPFSTTVTAQTVSRRTTYRRCIGTNRVKAGITLAPGLVGIALQLSCPLPQSTSVQPVCAPHTIIAM
jgi:hypothetical protein